MTDPEGDPMDATFYGREKSVYTREDFSLIVLPDTQFFSASYPEIYSAMTQWIVDNEGAENIAFVTHVGDIVNTHDSEFEWQNADAAMDKLDPPDIPYSVGPGNHDGGGLYSTYFGSARFSGKSYYGGYYSGANDNYNNYSLFSVSGMDFIIINLEFLVTQPMLDWADGLLKTHSDRRAIVVNHYILNIDNTWGNQVIYEDLKDNPNLFLMLCGHMHTPTDGAARRTEVYDGNTVEILLSDYQEFPNGGDGYLRLMTFSPIDDTVSVSTYSPTLDAYLTDADNAFTFNYDMETGPDFEVIGTDSGVASGSNASVAWTGLSNETEYEWYTSVSDGSGTTIGPTWRLTTEAAPINNAPVLDAIGNKNIPELTELSFTATASDVDEPAQSLTFSLNGEPPGASITSGGDFTWTPDEAQGPDEYSLTVKVCDDGEPVLCDEETITVDVTESNQTPMLDPIGNHNIAEQSELSFTATASDADDPAQALAFSLSDEPAGASITSDGDFMWTPNEAQGPEDHVFTVKVCDDGIPVLCGEEVITVSVSEINQAPVLDSVGNKSIPEMTELTFTATAADSDEPTQSLNFSLIGEPIGASITSSGDFTWTPDEAQGPDEYGLTVKVCDDGTPVLCDEEAITVSVSEANQAPVLDAIGDQSIPEMTEWRFTAAASDADIPAQTLDFSLSGEPDGAGITSGGEFSWTPDEAQGPGEYGFTVHVCDNGNPVLCDDETITVTVNEVNQAPAASDDSYSTDKNTPLMVVEPGVLWNDSDADGNVISAVLVSDPAHGDLVLNADGSFIYTPDINFSGEDNFTYKASDGELDSISANVVITVNSSGPTIAVFKSSAEYDGWIRESTESSSKGKKINSTGVTFLLGDDTNDRQYRSILHFDTADLPDDAIITKATLEIKQYTLVGTNPFTTHGKIKVDIRTGAFSGNYALMASDFRKKPSKGSVAIIKDNPVDGWYAADVSSQYLMYINKVGVTQFRLRFAVDDDDDLTADLIKFISGDHSKMNKHPQLLVMYTLPKPAR